MPATPAERALGPMLRVTDLEVYYGKVYAVQGVSLDVWPREVVAVLGANGAGKSSILRSVMGLTPARAGVVAVDGVSLTGQPPEARVARGLAYVPEGRRVFADLTVRENLLMGAYAVAERTVVAARIQEMFALFPILRERAAQLAATLSGGEQQMLAIARGLMRGPRLLLLDEPSLGLAPVLVHRMYETIRRIREQGVTILLAEQSAHLALQIADRAYVLETGRIAFSGDAAALRHHPAVREAYLAVGETP